MDNSLINITIATFGRKELLRRSLESAINQTYENLSITIVDDASPEAEKNYIADYLGLPNVSYIRLSKNIGAYQARNLSLLASKYDAIHFLDSDDFIEPNFIQDAASLLFHGKSNITGKEFYNYPEAMVTATKVIPLEEEPFVKGIATSLPATYLPGTTVEDTGNSYVRVIGGVFKKSVFQRLGGFMNVRVSADDDFRNKLVAARIKTVFSEQPYYQQFLQNDSLTVKEDTGQKSEFRKLIREQIALRKQKYIDVFFDLEKLNQELVDPIDTSDFEIVEKTNEHNLNSDLTFNSIPTL